MKVAFLFPGQGSQHAGMLHELPDHPEVARTLRQASEVLGRDVLELDEEKTLASTVSTQLAIYIAGVAVTRALVAEGAAPDAAAGLSIGAYAAASASGALDFPDGVRLVHLRGSLMENSFPTGYGLTAIVGLDESQVMSLVARATTPEAPVYVSNLNAPRQIVVAGADAGMARLAELAREAGCSKAERLSIRIPSHCPLLADIAVKLVDAMKDLPQRPITAQYISNRGARPMRSFDRIRDDVATSIAYTVRWYDATQVLVEMGTGLFVEANPGHVLSSSASEAFPQIPAIAVSSTPFETVVRRIKEIKSREY